MNEVGRQPIVITATGVACGLGLDAETTWQAVRAGRRGIGPMPAMESPLPPGSDGGQALDLPDDFAPDLPREARYLRWAITQALTNAGDLSCPPDRIAVVLGTTLHGMRAAGRFLRTGDYDHLRDFLAGDVLARATNGLAPRGPRATTCSACSSGLGAIALAVTMLDAGEADVVVAGGYDPVSEYAWAGFNSLRLVSGPPLRPFTKGRVGMKLAEAYAVVTLERESHARERGATILATVAGYGETADAHHLTQPHPEGRGASAAMRQAIDRAGLEPGDIGLACAHATGTPDNDAAEHAALATVFGDALPTVPVAAFKSHLGHTLGGAGAIELVLAAHAMRDGVLPPTVLDAGETVEFEDLNLTRVATPAPIRATLNTSLGFGGANTSIVLTPPTSGWQGLAPQPLERAAGAAAVSARQRSQGLEYQPLPPGKTVVLTGVGVILPGVYDHAAFRARLAGATSRERLDMVKVEALLNARRTRRMSDYVKLTLAAATLAGRQAFGDAGVPAHAAALLGTMHGSATFSETYYRQLLSEGVLAANPSLFAEGVPNAAAAQLSLMLGLVGPCQTIVGTRTAGLDALRLAVLRIASGEWHTAIISAGEEDSAIVAAAHAHCGDGPADDVSGAVALVIESAESAAARGATVLATLTDARAAAGPREAIVDTAVHLIRQATPTDRIATIGRAATVAARRAERNEQPFDLTPFGDRFSVTSLAAIAVAIEGRTSCSVLDTDPSGLAACVRLVPAPGTPGEG